MFLAPRGLPTLFLRVEEGVLVLVIKGLLVLIEGILVVEELLVKLKLKSSKDSNLRGFLKGFSRKKGEL